MKTVKTYTIETSQTVTISMSEATLTTVKTEKCITVGKNTFLVLLDTTVTAMAVVPPSTIK